MHSRWFVLVGGSLAAVVFAASPAAAVTPESAEVKAAIAKAIAYLSKPEVSHDTLGGQCLIGMVFLKETGDDRHPRVVRAAEYCSRVVKNNGAGADIYSLGIALMFLCDANASLYRPEIEGLYKILLARQKVQGGWGYPSDHSHGATGDTSMTQYAVLGTWAAARHGVQVSHESIENVCNWLLRTQDPEGGWGYQGNDPGPKDTFQRVKQHDVKPSMGAAGAGAMFICADLLGFAAPVEENREDDLPPALRLVKEKPANALNAKTVDGKLMNRSRQDAIRFIGRHSNDDPTAWPYYYLYALERFYSFRELSEGKAPKEPAWYNTGARYLLKNQKEDGSWDGQEGTPISTSFGVLFLMRGTRKSIEKTVKTLGEGNLVGGRGLPGNVANVKLKKGQLTTPTLTGSMEKMLAMLEDDDAPPTSDALDAVQLSADPAERKGQLARLRRLLANGAFEARQGAVKMLGRSSDLDNAPALIYALTDPDIRVAAAANEGLKFMSRRFSGWELPADPTDDQKRAQQAKWKHWYYSVRPDGELFE